MTALLSNRLRQWRLDAGLSIYEVGDLVGLSVPHLSRVERGERQLSASAKVQVARRLGVRVADLFELEPIPEESVAV